MALGEYLDLLSNIGQHIGRIDTDNLDSHHLASSTVHSLVHMAVASFTKLETRRITITIISISIIAIINTPNDNINLVLQREELLWVLARDLKAKLCLQVGGLELTGHWRPSS